MVQKNKPKNFYLKLVQRGGWGWRHPTPFFLHIWNWNHIRQQALMDTAPFLLNMNELL